MIQHMRPLAMSLPVHRAMGIGLLSVCVLLPMIGCGTPPQGQADAQTPRASRPQGATAVDVAIANPAPLQPAREYTGTTQPARTVSLRSQAEGQLLTLTVDVGDRVEQGQTLGQIDNSLLTAGVIAAEAELASRQSEVVQRRTLVSEAKTRVEQARLQMQQAIADADRLEQLAASGATTKQQAEQARTAAKSAAQVLRSTEEQVRNQEQAIAAAQGRLTAQQAVISQAQERLSYAVLKAPITGFVLERTTEAGNLVQPGNEIFKLGDFSKMKVVVQVSELELPNLRLGQTAEVKLDAFPKRSFKGRITRLSPSANPTSRLLPVEITLANPLGKSASGLLGRVSFASRDVEQIVVPVTALQEDRPEQGQKLKPSPNPSDGASPKGREPRRKTEGVVFVVTGDGDQATVQGRSVKLGEQTDGKVEILSGLKSGERYVVRSGKPLKDGEAVRLSILSEK